MNGLSLFSGIGGFDIGMNKAGIKTRVFCEINRQCQEVLERHWHHPFIYDHVGRLLYDISIKGPMAFGHSIDIVFGGDPCPCRSKARSNGKSKHPDLSGYFLAVVGQVRPRWVVRENVLAPDDLFFYGALELLGYSTVIIRFDAAPFTGQSRKRDFIIGYDQAAVEVEPDFLYNFKNNSGSNAAKFGTGQIVPALTTNRTRYDSRDCYIWEESKGLRILDGEERTAFAGFPDGWLAGLSEAACARMLGNAVVPEIAYLIGKAIMEAENDA